MSGRARFRKIGLYLCPVTVHVSLFVRVRVCVCEDIIVVEERQYGRRLQSVDGGGSSVSRFSLLCCCLSSALCAYVFVEG